VVERSFMVRRTLTLTRCAYPTGIVTKGAFDGPLDSARLNRIIRKENVPLERGSRSSIQNFWPR